MSFKSNNLDDIKSLYESIHYNISEEVEDLNEIGGGGTAAAITARNQRIQAQGQVKSALGQGKGIGLQSASGLGQGTAQGQKAYGTQLGGRQGVVVKGGAAGPNLGPRGGSSFTRAADTVNVGGQTLYKAQKGKDIVYLQGKGGPQLFKPGAKNPPAAPPTGAPRPPVGGSQVPGGSRPPVGGSRPPVSGTVTPGGTKVAPAVAGSPAAPMSAMDKWRAANPKLAAASDERARIRGTQQTDNPLMKDMRSRLPMNSPSVQSPSVAKLGPGNQSLVQNPNAFKAATPTAGLGAKAFSSPTPGSSAFRAATPAQATAAAPSTSPAASGSVAPVSNRIAAQSSAQQAKSPTFSQAMRMPSLMQSFDYDDAFELVIEYLIDSGHADNLYEAEYIMNELEPEALADIVEAQYGTAAGRKKLAKKVRAGKDVGKKGEGFKKIVKKASKKYGKERATKIAAAAMWKNLAKEE